MTRTVTIHRLRSGFVNIADDFTIDASLADEFRGDDSADYELPAGFHIARSRADTLEVYDAHDGQWSVAAHAGRPCLVSASAIISLAAV